VTPLDLVARARGLSGRRLGVALAALALVAVVVPVSAAPKTGPLGNFKHIVVIYEENHSFDNLYGLWGDVNGQHVVGLADADPAHTSQVDEFGNPYQCLLQTDVNLRTSAQTYPGNVSGHLTESCTQDLALPGSPNPVAVHISSAFRNAPYLIDDYIASTDVTCPPLGNLFGFANGIDKTNPVAGATAGGCTRDLVHRFYQEQYQINGGHQNRYITGSDSAAMSFGYYDTTELPIYRYLHANGAPKYVLADHFFQAAFGGSFLNHQFLIAAAAPDVTGQFGPTGATRSVANADGMVRSHTGTGCSGAYPLFTSTDCLFDGNSTQACGPGADANGMACGDHAVNTMLPWYQPTSQGFANKIRPIDDSTTDMTIGDLMSDGGVSWAYYGGGWDNASGNVGGRGWTNGNGPTCSDPNGPAAGAFADGDGLHAGYPYCPHFSYQQHHYPFAYFTRYNTANGLDRVHLQDEEDFLWAAANGQLPQVSFVKPVGSENEHPGYASEPNGSDHLVDLIQAVMNGPQAGNTLIVVTYDEYGGQWDHVPPPSNTNDVAAHDKWGPGTRIPALLLARSFTRSGVDHTYLDTLSIMRTVELQWGLGNLGHRDADVNSLAHAIAKGRP
jgi:acid phosphatase